LGPTHLPPLFGKKKEDWEEIDQCSTNVRGRWRGVVVRVPGWLFWPIYRADLAKNWFLGVFGGAESIGDVNFVVRPRKMFQMHNRALNIILKYTTVYLVMNEKA
jgi:hypothetical protein